MAQLLYWPNLRMKLGFSRTASLQKRPKPEKKKTTQTQSRRMGGLRCTRKGGGVGSLPGLVARQHEPGIIEQGWECVADCGPVLISKRVGAQIDIGPSEGLL